MIAIAIVLIGGASYFFILKGAYPLLLEWHAERRAAEFVPNSSLVVIPDAKDDIEVAIVDSNGQRIKDQALVQLIAAQETAGSKYREEYTGLRQITNSHKWDSFTPMGSLATFRQSKPGPYVVRAKRSTLIGWVDGKWTGRDGPGGWGPQKEIIKEKNITLRVTVEVP